MVSLKPIPFIHKGMYHTIWYQFFILTYNSNVCTNIGSKWLLFTFIHSTQNPNTFANIFHYWYLDILIFKWLYSHILTLLHVYDCRYYYFYVEVSIFHSVTNNSHRYRIRNCLGCALSILYATYTYNSN
jgi:hypothetical protein